MNHNSNDSKNESERRDQKRSLSSSEWLILGTLFVLTVLLFGKTLYFDFVYDDIFQIVRNSLVRSDESTVLAIFFSPTFPGDLYRPITTFSYRLNYLLTGLSPGAFHLINIVLHFIVSVLVFLFAQRIGLKRGASALAAILVVIMPINVEAVANIVGRGELFAALFSLVALLSFLNEREDKTMLFFGAVSFFIACGSKESALTVVLLSGIMTTLQFLKEKGVTFRKWFYIFLLPGSLYLVARLTILGPLFFQERDLVTFYVENPLLQEELSTRLIASFVLLGRYVEAMIIPFQLSADYSATEGDFYTFIGSVKGMQNFFIGLTVCVVGFLYRRTKIGFALLWIPITFFTTLHILTPAGTIMGDRLAYLPSIGYALFIASLTERFFTRRLELILVVLLCFSYILLSHQRVLVWRSNKTLFLNTVLDRPRSPKALVNYGLYLLNEKKEPRAAEEFFKRAISLDPDRGEYYRYYVNTLLMQQKYKPALFWLNEALKFTPNDDEMKKIRDELKRITAESKRSLDMPE